MARIRYGLRGALSEMAFQTSFQEPVSKYDTVSLFQTALAPTIALAPVSSTDERTFGTAPAPAPVNPVIRSVVCRNRASSGGAVAQQTQVLAESRPIIIRPDAQTTTDAYARGVVQGLQRTIVSFASSHNIPLEVLADGTLSPATVAATIAILEKIGLPPGVEQMPTNAEQLSENLRSITEHIARSAGVQPNLIPGDSAVLRSSTETETKASRFSGRGLALGALGVFGLIVLSR